MPNCRLTSFATYRDLVGYIRCLQDGHSTEFCYNRGDNGVGAFGKVTAQTSIPMCALSPQDMKEKWGTESDAKGKLVKVYALGREVICELQDIGPHGVCDLNPAALIKLGLSEETELSTSGSWEWLDLIV